jgi:hypothetical protein
VAAGPACPYGYADLVFRFLIWPLFGFGCLSVLAHAQTPARPFNIEETTISQVHDAMRAGRLTCHALVSQYLKRIEAYNKNGPGLNAIVLINPEVEKEADDLDRRFAQTGLTGR